VVGSSILANVKQSAGKQWHVEKAARFTAAAATATAAAAAAAATIGGAWNAHHLFHGTVQELRKLLERPAGCSQSCINTVFTCDNKEKSQICSPLEVRADPNFCVHLWKCTLEHTHTHIHTHTHTQSLAGICSYGSSVATPAAAASGGRGRRTAAAAAS